MQHFFETPLPSRRSQSTNAGVDLFALWRRSAIGGCPCWCISLGSLSGEGRRPARLSGAVLREPEETIDT